MNTVRPGDRLTIRAQDWNELARLVDSPRGVAAAISATDSSRTVVKVRNLTGSTIERFGLAVITTGSSPTLPANNLEQFLRDPVLNVGAIGVSGLNDAMSFGGRFVVAIEPIKNNEIGRAVLRGVVPVKIHASTTPPGAYVIVGTLTDRLYAAPFGFGRILWSEATASNPRWALVRLGESQLQWRFTLSAVLNKGGSATATALTFNAGAFHYPAVTVHDSCQIVHAQLPIGSRLWCQWMEDTARRWEVVSCPLGITPPPPAPPPPAPDPIEEEI